MDMLSILKYGGIILLILLLVCFEWEDSKMGNAISSNTGYAYYLHNKTRVKIRHISGTRYKVYVFDNCPVETRHDRYGEYFLIKASSAAEAEYQVDEIYRNH